MPSGLNERSQSLELSAERVAQENPNWSDEMVRDYIGKGEDIKQAASAVDNLPNIALLAAQGTMKTGFKTVLNMIKKHQDQTVAIERRARNQNYARLTLALFAQVINNGSTQVITGFTGASKNIGASTSQISTGETGSYQISFSCGVDSALATNVTAELYKNSVATGIKSPPIATNGLINVYTMLSFNAPVYLSSSDVIEVRLSHDSGSPVSVGIANVIFGAI